MKIGDLVEFKPGTFGIDSPENLGIVLDRKSKKPNVIVTLLTVKGKMDTRADKLTKRKFDINVDLSKKKKVSMDELKARLREWIKEFAQEKHTKQDEQEITERILWDAMKGISQPLTAREIAEAFYGTSDLKKRHLNKVNAILNNCIPTGVGYFERVSTGPSKWLPLSEDEYKRINQEITRLGTLKKKMLTTVTEYDEELDEMVTRVVAVPLTELNLSDEEKETLQKMQEWMASFVVHDQWSQVGLAGTRTHTIDNFSLGRFLKWFVEDWTQLRGTTIANMFTAFLLDTGYWEPKDAVEAIARRVINQTHGFDWDTPESVERLAQQYEEPNDTPELWEGRVDLRHLETYTIDPPTAKDFDDAISFIPHDDGSVTLYVHIADVANYVKKDSLLDTHAFQRSTSVYLPVKVLPMLPSRLSDDLCSLRENLVRLAMTVKIEYDKHAKVVNTEPMESIILVNKNLSYDQVNQWIEEGKEPFKSMNDFAVSLWNKRLGLELETAEARLEFGVDTIGVNVKEASAATKMIETFMVAANEAIAHFLLEHDVIGIYRCHPLPDKTSVEKFNHQATALRLQGKIELPELPERFREEQGVALNEEEEDNILEMLKSGGTLELGGFSGITIKKKGKKGKKEAEPEPEPEPVNEGPKEATPITVGIAQLTPEEREAWLKPFNTLIKEIKAIPDVLRQQVSFLTLLRVLGRAIYTPGNIGHFGLGSEAYTHFTSPIRRYADLIAHRLVKGILRGEIDHDNPLYSVEEMEKITSHTTEQSILAETVERQVVASGLTIYTRDDESWKEPQRSIVSALTSGGAFVLLRDSVEGKIPIYEITTEKTFIDETESMLFIGTSNPERIIKDLKPENWKELVEDFEDPVRPVIQLGDELIVTLTNWDYIDGKILVKPLNYLTEKPENKNKA